VQIVNATTEHFTDVADLVASPEELYMVSPKSTYPWDLTQVIETRLSHTVCLVGGVVAAYANLYDVTPGQTAFIGNVIVSDAFKGQGVGKALLNHMIKLCKDKYDAVPHLSVFAFNTRALLMYAGLGFEPYEVEPREGLHGERGALVHMRVKT